MPSEAPRGAGGRGCRWRSPRTGDNLSPDGVFLPLWLLLPSSSFLCEIEINHGDKAYFDSLDFKSPFGFLWMSTAGSPNMSPLMSNLKICDEALRGRGQFKTTSSLGAYDHGHVFLQPKMCVGLRSSGLGACTFGRDLKTCFHFR